MARENSCLRAEAGGAQGADCSTRFSRLGRSASVNQFRNYFNLLVTRGAGNVERSENERRLLSQFRGSLKNGLPNDRIGCNDCALLAADARLLNLRAQHD